MQGGTILLLLSFAGATVFSHDIPTECPTVDPVDTTIHLQHEYNCDQFYKCYLGEKHLYDCAKGTVFDPKLQVCVWPWETECSLPGSGGDGNGDGDGDGDGDPDNGSGGDGTDGGAVIPPTECPAVDPLDTTVHLAHEYDCNKFYKCSNGVKYLYSCAPSDPPLVFDPVKQVCVWPQDFECKLPGSPGGSGGSNEQPTNGSSEPAESDEPAQSNETPEETSADSEGSSGGGAVVPPTECPAVDPLDTTVHIAHEYDCNKFYKCSNGVKYLYSCAPSDPELVFDPVLQVCVWPEDFECKLPGPPGGSGGSNEQPTNGSSEPAESDEPAQSNETPKETSADSEDSSGGGAVVPPTECPAVDPLDTTVHIAHEYDCNKFYKCSNGVKYLYSCAPSDPELVFDPVLQVCVWPEDFECKLPGSPGGSGGSNEQPTNGSSEPAESNEPAQSNETPEETSANSEDSSGGGAVVPPTECPAVDPLETTVHIAHEYDCNKFYKCSNGVKYLYSCAPSDPELVFDPVLQVCVWPEDFECKLPGSPGGSGGSNEQPTNGSSEPAESNEPGQSNETPEETSANSEDSSGGGAVVPPTECPAVDPLDTTVHIAHEYDCNKFYKCSNGVKYLYSCAPSDPELVFDPVLQVCVWPEDFECKLPGPPGGSGGSNEQPTNGSSEPAESDEPAQSNETPEETSANSEDSSGGGAVVPPTECPAVDPLDTTVHIAHEYDCNKFYKCSNGVKYLYSCAPSDPELVFDPVLQVCVWPEDFECKLPGSPGGSDGSNEQPTNGSSEPAESEEPAQSNETPEETSADSEGSSGGGAVVPPTECPAVDPLDTTVHIAHEYDCNKFYKCSNGVKYLYSCAPSDPELVFDPVLQVCVWPEDFECKLPGSPGGSDGSNEQPTNGSSEPAESEEPAQSNETPEETSADSEGSSGGGAVVPPTECPAVDPLDTTVHIAHKYDCNKFYKCSNGVKYLYSCAPSDPELVFDPILQVCVWPEDFECTLPGTPGGSGGSNEQPTNGSSEPTESDEPAESNEPAQSNETSESSESSESREVDPVDVPDNSKCDVCDNNSNIWPHETDCDKFWICQNSNAVLTTCSLGLQFNTLTRTCDFACNVNCVKSGSLRAMARQNGLNIVIPWDKIGAKVLHKLEHDLHEVGVKYE